MPLIVGYMGHHHMHNTITLQGWSVETCASHHFKSAIFRSPKTKNKEASPKYQLHMEEAKKGGFILQHSLIEGC